MTFRFIAGYYVRRLASAVLALIIGLAMVWGSLGMGDNLSILRTILQALGFFLILGSGLGIIGAFIGIFITRSTALVVENGIIKLLAGKREVMALTKENLQGVCYDYESIAPSPSGLRYNPAKPTALRLIAQNKVYLILTSRMYEDELKRLSAAINEQIGVNVYTLKLSPEIATFPNNKYERGESGLILLTPAFLLGYKDTTAPNPVLREGILHFFIPTNQIARAEPASSIDLPGSSGSGRTAILRLTLKDETTKNISLGFAARTTGPDYRKVLQKWVTALNKLL
jgi:hypothetical protein